MEARWNLDLLRGALMLYALHGVFQGIGAFRLGVDPYQATQFWFGLGIMGLYAALFLALLFPSRGRLQTVFILFTVAAIAPILSAFWWMRNYPTTPPSLFFVLQGEAIYIPAAVAAWFLYRAEPKL